MYHTGSAKIWRWRHEEESSFRIKCRASFHTDYFSDSCTCDIATLSLVTSRSQNQRARQNAHRAKAYGEASAAAEDKLAEIDRILYDSYHSLSVPDEESYFLNAMQSLAGVSDITADSSSEGLLITYHIPITDTQELQAELLAVYPADAEEAFYRILKWSAAPADTWNADDTLLYMEIINEENPL